MNLIEARKFVESDQALFKENIPKKQMAQYKACLRVFKRSRELSHAERIRLLQELQLKITLSDENDPLIKKVQFALAFVNADHERIKDRLHIMAEQHRFHKKNDALVDYAILDSLPELPGHEAGLSEDLVIQFFLFHLKDFNRAFPSVEVSHLIESLENLFELSIYTFDLWNPSLGGLPKPKKGFLNKVLCLLIQMAEGRLAYFFLPCSSKDHAMVGKVEWFDREGYRFTIINTGGGVRFREGKKAYDAVYSGLTQEELMDIAKALLVESENPEDVYAKIAKALPQKNCTYFNSRKHSWQRRDSCSVKSLTVSMHSVLPEKIYWQFKVFYTKQLMMEMTIGPKNGAAAQILAKRTKKSLIGDI